MRPSWERPPTFSEATSTLLPAITFDAMPIAYHEYQQCYKQNLRMKKPR
jgi:hypothetical protein